jgi:hypothetical protein
MDMHCLLPLTGQYCNLCVCVFIFLHIYNYPYIACFNVGAVGKAVHRHVSSVLCGMNDSEV